MKIMCVVLRTGFRPVFGRSVSSVVAFKGETATGGTEAQQTAERRRRTGNDYRMQFHVKDDTVAEC